MLAKTQVTSDIFCTRMIKHSYYSRILIWLLRFSVIQYATYLREDITYLPVGSFLITTYRDSGR